MSQAFHLLRENHIGRLPVIDKNSALVGIVSDNDLKRAAASDASTMEVHELTYLLSQARMKDIMTTSPITVHIHDTIEEAAQIMLEKKISGTPVRDNTGKIVAMLTQSDIFRALIALTGVTHGGIQFAIDLPDEPGTIKIAADILRKHGGRMVSILSTYDGVMAGWRRVYIRMKRIDRGRLMQIKDELVQVGGLHYILDSSTHTKELINVNRSISASA